MKNTKRLISLVLCLTLALTLISASAYAADGKTNLSVAVSPATVEQGGTVTVTISNSAMQVSSITGGVEFDKELLECTSVEEGDLELDPLSTVDEANSSGTVGFAIIGTKDRNRKAGTMVTATFKAKKTGTATFTLYEDSDGTDGYKSDNAGTAKVEITAPAEKHTLTKVAAKAATCTEAGYKEYWKCSDCGKLFSDSEAKKEISAPETVAALGHNLTKTAAKAATCTADGNTEYYTCSRCGKLFSDSTGKTETTKDKTVVKATGHNWGEWTVTKAATELETGTETRTCKNDASHKETRTVPATGIHSMTKVAAKAATCTADGNIEYYKCSGCGRYFSDADGKNEIEKEDTVVKATGHDWGDWVVTKEPTKSEKGSETRTCKNDASHKETREVPALEHIHSMTQVKYKAATCTEDGNIAYWVCTDCGRKFADQKATKELQNEDVVIRATGHSWGEWKVTKEPTATAMGVEQRVCKYDSKHVQTRYLPATGGKDVKVEVDAADGGKVSPSEVTVREGDSQEFTVTPDEGYEIADVKVNGKSIGAKDKFTVENISSETTIKVTFKKKSVDPEPTTDQYKDVKKGSWYYDAVNYATEKGYVAGVGNGLYAPNRAVTRATVAQIVFAMEGKPAGTKSAGFKDVPDGQWFTDAINWCAAKGIVAGYNKDSFGPNDPITRQQLATILYQYAKLKGYDTAASGDLSKFNDGKDVSTYAVTPMKWAVGHGLISGTDIGLEPKGTATRAQIAVILQAFDKNVK